MPEVSRGWLIVLAGYLLMLAVLAGLLVYARSWALDELASDEMRAKWHQWQEDERKRMEDPDQPVRRRVPTSPEPPLLVLLRDAFAGVLLGVLLFATVMYGFAAVVGRSIWQSRASPPPDASRDGSA